MDLSNRKADFDRMLDKSSLQEDKFQCGISKETGEVVDSGGSYKTLNRFLQEVGLHRPEESLLILCFHDLFSPRNVYNWGNCNCLSCKNDYVHWKEIKRPVIGS